MQRNLYSARQFTNVILVTVLRHKWKLFLIGLLALLHFFGPLYTFVVVECAIATLITAVAVSIKRRVHVSRNWPVVQGIVISSSVDTGFDYTSSRSGLFAGSTSRKVPVYCANLKYAYSVASKEYVGSNITLDDDYRFACNREVAQHQVLLYTSGSLVAVHYDPSNPAHSVLRATAHTGTLVAIAACLIAVATVQVFLQFVL